jgi:hypothetical protein
MFGKTVNRYGIFLPEVSAFQCLKAILTGAAHKAVIDGDWPRAIRCLTATAAFARQVWDEEQFVVIRLYALSVLDSAGVALANMLAEHCDSAGDDDLRQAINVLQSWDPEWQTDLFVSSRKSSRDFLSDLYSADGRFTKQGFEFLCMHGNPAQQPRWFAEMQNRSPDISSSWRFQLLGPCLVPLVAGRDELLREWDQLSELYAADLQLGFSADPVGGAYGRELERLDENQRLQLRYFPILVQGRDPWLKAAIEGRRTKSIAREAVLIVIAAELFHRRQGAWPPSSESLSPDFLKTTPVDPYDGKPLRLRMFDGRPAVYSVGLNGRDDTAERNSRWLKELDERDWQLFPPIRPKSNPAEGK